MVDALRNWVGAVVVVLGVGLVGHADVIVDLVDDDIKFKANTISQDAIKNVPGLAGAYSFDVLVSSDLDLISAVVEVDLDPGVVFYQSAFGDDMSVPNPILVELFPELAFDTYVSMPGDTQLLSGGFDDQDGDTPGIQARLDFGDLSNDGEQVMHQLVRVTVGNLGQAGTHDPADGQITVTVYDRTSATKPAAANSFPIPEPTSLCLLALGGAWILRRAR